MKVRDKLPVRRNNPDRSETGKNYTKHKPNLEEDFNHHCGYCGAFDGFGYTKTYFEIDHFIPKGFLIKNNSRIGLCKYNNLVYSCRFCNNNKSNLWPTQKENISNKNDEGFINPCNAKYEEHLYRTSEGAIMWKTKLGKWMATQAFKFDQREEEIKLLWNYNQIRIIIESLIELLNKEIEGNKKYNLIYQRLVIYNEKHFFFQKSLREFYNNE